MKEHILTTEETGSRKKKTLLERYEIPVDHLDFKYINSCKDAREVERILKVLRSGEEGYFPDLEKCVVARLEKINPKSRVLRVETPILKSDLLDKKELGELQKSFLDWVDKIEEENSVDCWAANASANNCDASLIFQDESFSDVPIRTTTSEHKEGKKIRKENQINESMIEDESFARPKNPNRIKSWEYDKWDKFDVDTELTKLDIDTLQSNERDQELDVAKLKKEQELVKKYMKNIDVEEKKQKMISNPIKHKSSSTVAEHNEVPALEDDDSNFLTELIPKRTECTSKGKAKLDVPSSSAHHSARNFIIKEFQENSIKSSLPSSKFGNPSGKSFIEEIPDSEQQSKKPTSDERKGQKSSHYSTTKPKRRFKIQIEDLHLS